MEIFYGLYTQSWLTHVNAFSLRNFLGGSTPTKVLTMLSPLTGPGYLKIRIFKQNSVHFPK